MANGKAQGETLETSQEELLHLLKNGRSEEVAARVRQMEKTAYTDNFVTFMDQMIREHRVSRKQIALRSGLSQDYTYKLLRGDKHTDERDYILAMCLALGMNLSQTQHALGTYGMPLLSGKDVRSHIIQLAIVDGRNMDEINDMLEKAGYPLIRTNPDMPSAPIHSSEVTDGEMEPARAGKRHYEETESFVDARRCGMSPMDYMYTGWIRLKDENGKAFQVEAVYHPEGTSLTVFPGWRDMEDENLQDTEEECLESYESLEDAAASAFFPWFLEIDRRTDRKVMEVVGKVDDTREYGCRVGSAIHGDAMVYIEVFNDRQPELREYFQVVMHRDGSFRYTASHESVFLRLEMGRDLYELYYGKYREPEYYIDTAENHFSGEKVRYRFIFTMATVLMFDFIEKHGAFVIPDAHLVEETRLEYFAQQGAMHMQEGDYAAAVQVLQQAVEMLGKEIGDDRLCMYLCFCRRIICALNAQGKERETKPWHSRIRAMRDRVLAWNPENAEHRQTALDILAENCLYDYGENRENPGKSEKYLLELMDLLEHHGAAREDWGLQLSAFSFYAWYLEEKDVEKAVSYYRRAIATARDHRLEEIPSSAPNVVAASNNLGWVLWNLLDSEEAILHYGRALDLLEMYMSSGVMEKDAVLDRMDHMGSALHDIYLETGREKEAEALRSRLGAWGVHLKEDTGLEE